MKLFLVFATISLGVTAYASEPINCLQWHFQAENKFVSSKQAAQVAKDILSEGARFGFIKDGKQTSAETTDYYFKYNRDSVIDHPQVQMKYRELMRNIEWHLNSRLGYNFKCSFEADGPRPRISGSN